MVRCKSISTACPCMPSSQVTLWLSGEFPDISPSFRRLEPGCSVLLDQACLDNPSKFSLPVRYSVVKLKGCSAKIHRLRRAPPFLMVRRCCRALWSVTSLKWLPIRYTSKCLTAFTTVKHSNSVMVYLVSRGSSFLE